MTSPNKQLEIVNINEKSPRNRRSRRFPGSYLQTVLQESSCGKS